MSYPDLPDGLSDISAIYKTSPTRPIRIVTITSTKNEEEFFARFLKITEGNHTALVFYHDESDVAWAHQMAEGLAESSKSYPQPDNEEA